MFEMLRCLTQKLSDGKLLSGSGRLTLSMVDSLQCWYVKTIRNDKENVERMSSKTMTILLHYSEKG